MSCDRVIFHPSIAAAPEYCAGTSIEEAARRCGAAEIVKLASNENPLGPSRRAVAAIRAAVAQLHRYPPLSDEALRGRLAGGEGAGFGPEHVVCGNGGTDLLALVADAFLNPGDEAIVCPPTFPLYEILVSRRGARAVRCDLRTPGFAYDAERILRAVTPATRVLFLCSPVNPTGTLLTAAQAELVMAELPDRVVTVFDESYRDFVDDPAAADGRVWVRAGRPVLAVRSLSKSMGLAGLRFGWGIAPPQLAGYLRRMRNPFASGSLALAGAIAALEDRAHLERTRRLVLRERSWLFRALEARGLAPVPSQANFILFRPGLPPETVYERLLERGVVVRPAAFFQQPEAIRVSLGTRAQNRRFLAALDEVLAEIRPGAPA